MTKPNLYYEQNCKNKKERLICSKNQNHKRKIKDFQFSRDHGYVVSKVTPTIKGRPLFLISLN